MVIHCKPSIVKVMRYMQILASKDRRGVNQRHIAHVHTHSQVHTAEVSLELHKQ